MRILAKDIKRHRQEIILSCVTTLCLGQKRLPIYSSNKSKKGRKDGGKKGRKEGGRDGGMQEGIKNLKLTFHIINKCFELSVFFSP